MPPGCARCAWNALRSSGFALILLTVAILGPFQTETARTLENVRPVQAGSALVLLGGLVLVLALLCRASVRSKREARQVMSELQESEARFRHLTALSSD
jgi:hypothetical protein